MIKPFYSDTSKATYVGLLEIASKTLQTGCENMLSIYHLPKCTLYTRQGNASKHMAERKR